MPLQLSPRLDPSTSDMLRLRRIVVRIRRRHLGVDRLRARRAARRAACSPTPASRRRCCVCFADVVAQVVQLDARVVVELDEPVVAAADRAVRRRAALLVVLIVRIVPDTAAARVTCRPVAVAARGSRRRTPRRGSRFWPVICEDRRKQVHRDRRHVALAARLRHVRPVHDQRHAHAAFVARAFADAQRRVRRRRHAAAVVRRENDDRAIGDSQLVERFADAADRFVQALDHRGVGGVRVLRIAQLAEPLFVLLQSASSWPGSACAPRSAASTGRTACRGDRE